MSEIDCPDSHKSFGMKEFFRWVGNSFGHFFGPDNVTVYISRLAYVMIYVNVVVNRPLPNFISLKSKWGKWSQAIIYMRIYPYIAKLVLNMARYPFL